MPHPKWCITPHHCPCSPGWLIRPISGAINHSVDACGADQAITLCQYRFRQRPYRRRGALRRMRMRYLACQTPSSLAWATSYSIAYWSGAQPCMTS